MSGPSWKEPDGHFYPEAFFIGSDAWHKFIVAVGDVFCAGDPVEARCVILELLYELACISTVEVTFVSGDPSPDVLSFGPRTTWDEGPCCDTHDWLDRAEEFSVLLAFAGNPEEARFREPPANESHVEDIEKRANDSLSTRVAINWFYALRLTGVTSVDGLQVYCHDDERHWSERNHKVFGGDVVQLFADVLRISRRDAALRILCITVDDYAEAFAPKLAGQRLKQLIEHNKSGGAIQAGESNAERPDNPTDQTSEGGTT